jgi:hypothetical protein
MKTRRRAPSARRRNTVAASSGSSKHVSRPRVLTTARFLQDPAKAMISVGKGRTVKIIDAGVVRIVFRRPNTSVD